MDAGDPSQQEALRPGAQVQSHPLVAQGSGNDITSLGYSVLIRKMG